MPERRIENTTIEHNGDVDRGIQYLDNHWNDQYVLDLFENARTSYDYKAFFKIDNTSEGSYLLKYIGPHHYFLSWQD